MESDQKNIEGIVLPLFGIRDATTIEWGSWSPDHNMCMFAPLKIGGKQYVVVQDEDDGFPDDSAPDWLEQWRKSFSENDFKDLPFALDNPVKAEKPYQYDGYHNAYVVCLEENPAALNYYMLFEG